jgi:hypothetical protein
MVARTERGNVMTHFISVSVIGGWQTALVYGDRVEVAFGPVFNSVLDLWKWQGANLEHCRRFA